MVLSKKWYQILLVLQKCQVRQRRKKYVMIKKVMKETVLICLNMSNAITDKTDLMF